MKKNTITKKLFLILACIWLIITFSIVKSTYAKYVTNVDANANISISYWNILVNTQDILKNPDLTAVMTAVLPGDDYTKPGALVPHSTGYFDLNFDSSKVGLPFVAEISTSINENSDLKKDFKITGYSVNNSLDIIKLQNEENSFTYNIPANATSTTIRIYTTWLDDGTISEEETTLGISGGKAILNVNLHLSQDTN